MPNSTAHPTATTLADEGYRVDYQSSRNEDSTTTVTLTAYKEDQSVASTSATDFSQTQATLQSLDQLNAILHA